MFITPTVLPCAQLGRTVGAGSRFGIGTGEGASRGDCAKHKVKIYNHYADEEVELEVPEDRWGGRTEAAAAPAWGGAGALQAEGADS